MTTNGNEGGEESRDFGVLHRRYDVAGSNPVVPTKLPTPEETFQLFLQKGNLQRREEIGDAALVEFDRAQILARLEELKNECCTCDENWDTADPDVSCRQCRSILRLEKELRRTG